MRFGRLLWGFIILFIGVLLLGINFGWWNESVWRSAFDLWPLFLILLGAGIIFGKDSIIPAVLLVAMSILGILYISNFKDLNKKMNTGRSENVETQKFSYDTDTNIEEVKLDLNLGAANIEVNSLNNDSKLYEVFFESNSEIRAKNNINGNVADINFSEDHRDFGIFNPGNTKRNFSLSLNKSIPMEINIDSGASKLDLDFSAIKLTKLKINAGASKSNIKIGSVIDKVTMGFDIGASKSNILLPKEYALCIISDSGLLENNFGELGLKKQDNTYKSDDFDSSPKQIELRVSADASTLEIERY